LLTFSQRNKLFLINRVFSLDETNHDGNPVTEIDAFSNKFIISFTLNTPLKIEEQQTYLGVTFDKRMTRKQHITSAEAKARRKMNIMRKLAGTKWGANEKILKSVYQGNVRQHLEYGSSSWMTAAKTHHHDLRQSSEPGTTNHHRYYEVNTNTKYGRDYKHTTIT
jgi:hypothetical protein